MLGRLLPRDDQFFVLFDQLAAHLATTAQRLDTLFGDVKNVNAYVKEIKDIEHKADLLTATVNQRIDKSFITPIDREDIHTLASRLDHPYAAHVYAFGAEPDGLVWIAMERVRGTSLAEVLAAPPATERSRCGRMRPRRR